MQAVADGSDSPQAVQKGRPFRPLLVNCAQDKLAVRDGSRFDGQSSKAEG